MMIIEHGFANGAPMTNAERLAYNDGLRSGKADKRLGRVSDYARVCFPSEPPYVRYYTAGYRDGIRLGDKA
jgi:hypothetical protein